MTPMFEQICELIIALLVIFLLMPNASVAAANQENAYHYGVEIDALPYLTGGYYFSGFMGKGGYRIRGVGAKVKVPDFVVKDGFEENELTAYALIFDYFPGGKFEGLWGAAGFEKWDASIKSKGENAKSNYENDILTVGGGYLWPINEYFYINPWGAFHAIVGGDRRVNVGSRTYRPESFTGEISLKLGVAF